VHDLTILLIGVIVGLGLGVIVSAVRRTLVVGGPVPMATDVRQSPSAEEALASNAEAMPPGGAELTALPTGIPGQTSLRFSKTFVKRRIETRVTPDGIVITVDGATYHAIDEIPDPAARDQVRKTLASLPAGVTDPVLRAKVEGELEAIGITPDPSP
jgi:hypothetical protein